MKFEIDINGIRYRRKIVEEPKRRLFRNDEIDGRRNSGINCFKEYLDVEYINIKFIIVPSTICGFGRRNGIRNTERYITPN